MIVYLLPLFLSFSLLVSCERETKTFKITKSRHGGPEQTVGKLLIITDKSYDEVHAEIQPTHEVLIDMDQIAQSTRLTFTSDNQTFLQIFKGSDLKHKKEVINVILNNNYDIMAINYYRDQLFKKDTQPLVVNALKNQPAKDFILTYTPAKGTQPGQPAPEEETFFSKYKYYILGFGILVYVMSNLDPEKMNENLRQAQEQRGNAAR